MLAQSLECDHHRRHHHHHHRSEASLSLSTHTVKFTYCYDHPLECSATRYTVTPWPKARNNPHTGTSQTPNGFGTMTGEIADRKTAIDSATLLFISGISLQSETWIPVIQELYKLTSDNSLNCNIRSVWVVERPNHGDPGVRNARVLKEHYPVLFRSLEYAEAIRVFLDSDFMSTEEKRNLVGVGHSGGGGSLMQALELGNYPPTSLPFRSLVLLEVPYLGYPSFPYWQRLYTIVTRSNSLRPRSWASHDQALAWMKTHFPWKTFHPDVLRVIGETYFIEDVDGDGGGHDVSTTTSPGGGRGGKQVTTKTTLEQETACYLNDRTHLSALPYLRTLMGVLPTHWVFGSKNDIWIPEMYDMQKKGLEEDKGMLASVQTIEGVGHYFPVVKPRETAVVIVDILNGRPGGGTSVSSGSGGRTAKL
ncbi:hypothetical protein K435DRAFT_29078 [Dendrothele bispora CBS 962.96]|uniref:AB hydrolase-1 domain-containing protein n=1 Tax=Dendrothele bispora (strain CBS 962.96) TaxID=1314807 RepID=A0A4S8M8I4_DENBC|nr:hypothetical protein K435DRAFT_29078 [Dendrothele bispora CBS 962.96]